MANKFEGMSLAELKEDSKHVKRVDMIKGAGLLVAMNVLLGLLMFKCADVGAGQCQIEMIDEMINDVNEKKKKYESSFLYR